MSELIYRHRTGGEIKQHGLKTAAGSPIRTAQHDRYFFSPCARISLTQVSSSSITWILGNLYVNNDSGIQQPPHPQFVPQWMFILWHSIFPILFPSLTNPRWRAIPSPVPCLHHQHSCLETFGSWDPLSYLPCSLGVPYIPLPQQLPLLLLPWPSPLLPTTTTAGTSSPGILQQTLSNASLHIHFAIISGSPQGACWAMGFTATLVVAMPKVESFHDQSTLPKNWFSP